MGTDLAHGTHVGQSAPAAPLEPEPTPPDTWPVIWNEQWRPYEECAGNMGLAKTFQTSNWGNGIDSGMTTPRTHTWGSEAVYIYSRGS